MKDLKVKCYFCKKNIPINELGGVFKPKNKPELFCKNIVCLIKLNDWEKSNRQEVERVIK